jgi:hypothetical protein
MNVTHHVRTRDSGIVCLYPAGLEHSSGKPPFPIVVLDLTAPDTSPSDEPALTTLLANAAHTAAARHPFLRMKAGQQ